MNRIDIVKQKMESEGLSQRDLAKKSKVSQSTLSRFFSGTYDITLTKWFRILEAMKIRDSYE